MRWGDRRTAVWLAASVLAVAVFAGCADGGIPDEESGGSTSTTARRTTSAVDATTTTAIASDVVARYQAFWDARFQANTEPVNPDHPGLSEYATGAQLENVRAETAKRKEDGLAFRRPEQPVSQSRVRIATQEADRATLQECVVNDGVVYRVSDGSIVDDEVVTHSVEAVMVLVDGAWKLESARLVQRWEGVAGCALSGDF